MARHQSWRALPVWPHWVPVCHQHTANSPFSRPGQRQQRSTREASRYTAFSFEEIAGAPNERARGAVTFEWFVWVGRVIRRSFPCPGGLTASGPGAQVQNDTRSCQSTLADRANPTGSAADRPFELHAHLGYKTVKPVASLSVTLRTRVTLLALAGLVALSGAGFLTGSRFFEAQNAGQEVVRRLQPAADAATELIIAVGAMDRGVRAYVTTNKSVSLAPYANGVIDSATDIAGLDGLLANSQADINPLVDRVDAGRAEWLKLVAEPTIAAVRNNKQKTAEQTINSDASAQSFALLQAEAAALQSAIDDRRAVEFSNLTNFAQQLAIALLVSAAILIIGLVLAVAFLNLSVIRPLDRLRLQLRQVARERMHEVPIAPSGPPELRAAGQDAEEMRRQLVAEIDEARMAREGLEQEGPVVTAIRAELTRSPVAHAPGLDIFGNLQPAEGVLAGDWWDVLTLLDGRTAIMVTDVSGHGPQAGIAGLRAKLVLTTVLEAGGSLADAMNRAAGLFSETPSRYATCVIVVVDPFTRELEWSNAGHLSPLLMGPTSPERELGTTGPLLSTLGGDWVSRRIPMLDDDVLFLWTDGLSESHDSDGQELSEAGLVAVFARALAAHGSEPRELVASVLAEARIRAADWRRDDVTLIAACLIDRMSQQDNGSAVARASGSRVLL